MLKPGNNFAFVDIQNLYRRIADQGWKLDPARFRIYLRENFAVTRAILFAGYVVWHQDRYAQWQAAGFEIIFKEILIQNGIVKGNCDADMVLHTMIEFSNFEKAVIVTGDGDFVGLIKYLIDQNKLECVLIPHECSYSALLKRVRHDRIESFVFLNRARKQIEII